MILIPTHNELRNLQTYRHFVRRFERGLSWTERKYGIPVVVTEDAKCWLVDGHHEITASVKCGISIPANVLTIIRYDYYQLEEINFSKGYVTPFDPRKECRKSFHEYKHDVIQMYKKISKPEFLTKQVNDIVNYIRDNPTLYKEPRMVNSIEELIPKPITECR